MAHYNDVAGMLAPPDVEFSPLYDTDFNTDDPFWESWVCGFEQAMMLEGAEQFKRLQSCLTPFLLPILGEQVSRFLIFWFDFKRLICR